MSIQKLWYIRHGGQVLGPYPQKVISDHLLLGRMQRDAPVSLDKVTWTPLQDFPELIAPTLIAGKAGEHEQKNVWRRERRLASLRWANERQSGDRRNDTEVGNLAALFRRRSPIDRRKLNDPLTLTLRQDHATQELQLKHQRERMYRWVAVIILLALGVIALLIIFVPPTPVKIDIAAPQPACNQMARPQINWSACDKSGALLQGVDLTSADLSLARFNRAQLDDSNLSYANLSNASLIYTHLARTSLLGANLSNADLSHAKLSDADLRYADLRGAVLSATVLTRAQLDHAIWPNGRLCAAGSLGQCL